MRRGAGKKERWGRSAVRAAVAAGMLLAALVLPGAAIEVSAAEKEAVVLNNEVTGVTLAAAALQEGTIYAQPEETSAAIGTAAAGQALNICGQTADGWYETVFGNGIGYVKSSVVTVIAVEEGMAAALAEQAQFVKAQNAQKQSEMEAQKPAEQPLQSSSAGNLIFVGDSRTGQMGNAVGGSQAWPGTVFAACFGGGVDWLSGQKTKQDIDRFVTPGSVIILNYGVNDLSRHNDYISLINRYAADWRKQGAFVYFASVGPVGENEYGKRNWAVEYFNEQLGGRLDPGIGRIDLYGYLTASGYETLPDGLHYTPDTYARMFQFLCQSVGR